MKNEEKICAMRFTKKRRKLLKLLCHLQTTPERLHFSHRTIKIIQSYMGRLRVLFSSMIIIICVGVMSKWNERLFLININGH